MFLLLALFSCLAASTVQASHWPYHGSVPTVKVIGDTYGPGYSLSTHPIVVPDYPSSAVIGPSEGSVLVQGPSSGAASVIGPSAGAATIVGPSAGAASVIGPSAPAATIIGPSASGAGSIVVGPSGTGAIGLSEAPGATIIGPSAGSATVIGPSEGRATIIGPSEGRATIIGPRVSEANIIGSSVLHDEHAYADAHAHAEAHAHAHADALAHQVVIQPPQQTVYIKELIREPPIPIVHQIHGPHEHRVSCVPGVDGVSTSAAVNAIAHAGSHYGPVHVGSVLGRPVVTLSGTPLHHIGSHTGITSYHTSSHSEAAAAAAAASSSSHSDYSVGRKFWYPGPSWVKC